MGEANAKPNNPELKASENMVDFCSSSTHTVYQDFIHRWAVTGYPKGDTRVTESLLFEIKTVSEDDEGFMDGMNRMFSQIVSRYAVRDVFLIRVNNWFDEKWFAFAGNVREVYCELPEQEIHNVRNVWEYKNVVIPPFVPNRIDKQFHFNYEDETLVELGENARLVHPPVLKRSIKNLKNRIMDFCQPGLFMWFSSRSAPNGRASVMLYQTRENDVGGWYASFVRDDSWHIDKTLNIDKKRIERIFYEAPETASP